MITRKINMHTQVKKLLAWPLFLFIFFTAAAQSPGKIANKPIDAAIADIALILKDRIPNTVQLTGIGDVASFTREATTFNTSLTAFLISRKNVRHIVLFHTNWLLRPLNDYITGKSDFNALVIDSLVKISLGSTIYSTNEFRLFISWLKKYNLSNPGKVVSLSGSSGPGDFIPASYFLSTYVFPADKEHGITLSQKWSAASHADSLAFKDIETWYREKKKDAGFSNKHKDLLARCGEDIEYNKSVSNVQSIQESMATIANDILTKLKEVKGAVIFHAGNEMITKSKVMLNGVTVLSPGMLLHEKLKAGYYACITDFSDTAIVNVFDRTGLKTDKVSATQQAKELAVKKDCFFMPQDSLYLKQFVPVVILPIPGITRTIIPDNTIAAPADALFIFPGFTSATILKRNR